jgi:hypothetical protein
MRLGARHLRLQLTRLGAALDQEGRAPLILAEAEEALGARALGARAHALLDGCVLARALVEPRLGATR